MSDSNGSNVANGARPPQPDAVTEDAHADDETLEDELDGERSARLPPPTPVAPSAATGSGVSAVAEQHQAWPAPREPASQAGPAEPDPEEPPRRPSVLDALGQSRTTLYEVGQVAQRLSLLAPGLADARKVVRQAAASFAVGLTVVLLATLVFAGGAFRLVLGVVAGTASATLAVFAALRALSKLAGRDSARALPGPAWAWVGAVVTAAVAGTVAITMGVWQVTKPATVKPEAARPAPAPSVSAPTLPSAQPERADAHMKRGLQVGLGDGVLYVPPAFESADGRFDLIIHYHGNVELIEQSVVAAKLNALVHIINLGEGAGSYARPLRNPFVFDQMLGSIERRAENSLGLKSAQIRRIALSSWSAGFAALSQILSSRSRLDRVDALLLMDGLHVSFATPKKSEVYLPGLKPFTTFAQRAASGQKLMVVTHSAIETRGYASTTRTADALLQQLSLEREAVSPDTASPAPVDLSVAKRAFPSGERNWLRVTSQAHRQSFFLYGCSGKGKGDHIAHLAQMSVTVLPPLYERWK